MRSIFLLFILAIFFLSQSCQRQSEPENINKSFETFKQNFIESYWEQFPEAATMNGYHEHDDKLTIPDQAARNESIDFANQMGEILHEVPLDSLTDENRIDYYLIENQLQTIRWYTDTFKAWQWQPSYYNPGAIIGYMLKGRYAPLGERLKAIEQRLQRFTDYYEAAKSSITIPSKPHTEMAQLQTEGTLDLLQSDLIDSLRLAEGNWESLESTAVEASSAVKGYLAYLKELLASANFREFRVGQELYDRKFKLDLQASYDVNGIWEVAMMEKEEAHVQLLRRTQKLWPKYFGDKPTEISFKQVDSLIEEISNEHATADSFLFTIKNQIPELVEFVKEKNLVNIDPEKPLQIREAPKYLQGVALVSISAPGPYDKFESTYYNVNPIWEYPDSVSESWLREYNDYMIQILNIHEAIPGHYTQLVYANESPSIIKSVFGNTAMIEGWACYAERMMLQEGWGNDSEELWLMYYKWYLRIISNTIIDIGVHAKGWEKEQVMDLLVNEAFQEKSEAEGKWNRVKRTSVQLCSYFTGLTEIIDLRNEVKSRQGDEFNLREFHDEFLSYGSAPVKFIEQLMLRQETTSHEGM